MDRIVHVENISKKFGEHTIFKNFSMEIQRGEFVVITGESGSGKSTLLNMIGLLDSPDSVSYTHLFNRNVETLNFCACRRLISLTISPYLLKMKLVVLLNM